MLRAFGVAALPSQALWKGWQGAQLLPVPAEPGSLREDETLFVQHSQHRPAKASPSGRGGQRLRCRRGPCVKEGAAEQDDKMPRQVLHSICRGGFMRL